MITYVIKKTKQKPFENLKNKKWNFWKLKLKKIIKFGVGYPVIVKKMQLMTGCFLRFIIFLQRMRQKYVSKIINRKRFRLWNKETNNGFDVYLSGGRTGLPKTDKPHKNSSFTDKPTKFILFTDTDFYFCLKRSL